jgi:hypothetical protein
MKQCILLECDTFLPYKLKNWLSESNFDEKYDIYILIKTKRFKLFSETLSIFSNLKCITHKDLFTYKPNVKIDINSYFEFTKNYLNDQITARLLDRQGYWPSYGIGVQNGLGYYTDVSYNVMSFLKEKEIKLIYFRNTPHEAAEWVLAKLADFLAIDVYTSERFVLPWLFTLSKGYMKDRESVCEDFKLNPAEDLREHITNFVKLISDKYDLAMPSYEKNRLGRGVFRFYNPFKHFTKSIRRPHEFINKTINFFYYKKHAKQIDFKNTKYIVFFLHYQPERSTLPEGFEFIDQFYAIKTLSMMLPAGVKLVVKEHPSTFTRQSASKFRSLYHYKLLNKLINVDICPMSIDNFQLIDYSLAVVTITGMAAVEAYIRKKPVIILGLNNLLVKGVHGFNSIDELQDFIDRVANQSIVIDNVIENLFNLCIKKSASGMTKSPDDDIDYYLKNEYQEVAHYKLLSKLLNIKLNPC